MASNHILNIFDIRIAARHASTSTFKNSKIPAVLEIH